MTMQNEINLYQPIQPTANQSTLQVMYAELPPKTRLQEYIYCYWEFKSVQPLQQPFNHLIVADGCIDIFFEIKKPDNSYVMGFCKKYTEFHLSDSFHYIGIRFLPTAFPKIFDVDASELSNKVTDLKLITKITSNFISNYINLSLTFNQVKILFDNHFIELISKKSFNFDNRFNNALAIILQNQGVVSIEKELNTGISPRQLRRLFEFYVGDTAKTFSKVVRFQNILKAKPSRLSLRENKIFYDVGYYDQSHFIKEFQTFYGVTPSKAFKE